jgi:hypothetical protein
MFKTVHVNSGGYCLDTSQCLADMRGIADEWTEDAQTFGGGLEFGSETGNKMVDWLVTLAGVCVLMAAVMTKGNEAEKGVPPRRRGREE